MQDEVTPSARGLLLCLSALADEAGSLNMVQTNRALWAAIEACLRECNLIERGAVVPAELERLH